MQKILILGGTGLVGSGIDSFLSSTKKYKVIPCSRRMVNVHDPEEVLAIIKSVEPHVLINTVGFLDVDRAEDNPIVAREYNVSAIERIVESVKKVMGGNCSVFHISTSDVFSGGDTCYEEYADPQPVNVYGSTKWEGECVLRGSAERDGIPHFIIRTGWVYGSTRKTFVNTVIQALCDRRELRIADDQYNIPIWNMDIGRFIGMLLNQRFPSGVYHCAPETCELLSRYDIACMIAEYIGAERKYLRPVSRTMIFRVDRPGNATLINTKCGGFDLDWRRSLQTYVATTHGIS